MGSCPSSKLSFIPAVKDVDLMLTDNFRNALTAKLVWELGQEQSITDNERPALKNKVERMIHEYLIFMWIRKLNPTERISPSESVDVVWHQHILFTQEYAQFCQRHLGAFLHHVPTVPNYSKANHGDDTRDYAKVLIRYAYHTKLSPPEEFWPASNKVKAVMKTLQESVIVVGSRVKFLSATKLVKRKGGGIAVAEKKGRTKEQITDTSGAVIFVAGGGCGSMCAGGSFGTGDCGGGGCGGGGCGGGGCGGGGCGGCGG